MYITCYTGSTERGRGPDTRECTRPRRGGVREQASTHFRLPGFIKLCPCFLFTNGAWVFFGRISVKCTQIRQLLTHWWKRFGWLHVFVNFMFHLDRETSPQWKSYRNADCPTRFFSHTQITSYSSIFRINSPNNDGPADAEESCDK